MTDPIKEIFEHQFDLNTTIPSEGLDIYKEHEDLLDELESQVGKKIIDQLRTQTYILSHQSSFEWFQEGVRFGAALMLELFPPQHRVQ